MLEIQTQPVAAESVSKYAYHCAIQPLAGERENYGTRPNGVGCFNSYK